MSRNEWQHNNQKPMGCSKSHTKREVYSYTSLPKETRKISSKQSNLTPKGTRERRTNKTQSYLKEINHKDQSRNKWNRNKENNSKDQ